MPQAAPLDHQLDHQEVRAGTAFHPISVTRSAGGLDSGQERAPLGSIEGENRTAGVLGVPYRDQQISPRDLDATVFIRAAVAALSPDGFGEFRCLHSSEAICSMSWIESASLRVALSRWSKTCSWTATSAS